MFEEPELQAKDADAHYRQGQEFANVEDYESAIAEYSQAIELNPRHLKAIIGRGLSLQCMGKTEAAIADFDKGIAAGGTWAEAYYSRASAYKSLDRDAEALADYNAAIQMKPDYIDALYGRAVVLKKMGQMETALDDLNHVLTSNPFYSEARHTRATIHYFLGDWRRAIDDFDAFLVSQHHFGAYLLRGLACHQAGENESAIADLSSAIALRPEDGTTYIRRWQVYGAMGETAKAEADFAKDRSLMEKGQATKD
jgi:tetratricopeptide (TPR) repeat protein